MQRAKQACFFPLTPCSGDESGQGRHCTVPGLGAGGEGGEVRTSWRGAGNCLQTVTLWKEVYSLFMWWFGNLFEEKFECGKVCGFVSTVRGGSCRSFKCWICSSEPRLLNIYQALFHSNALKS